MPLPRTLARFNRHVTNRVGRAMAGPVPGLWIVRHTGRSTGREYRTPVAAFARDGGYIIALTYGPGSDWVKNVLKAGGCELRAGRERISLQQPRVVTDPDNAWAPRPVRLVLRLLDATQHLRMDILRELPRP